MFMEIYITACPLLEASRPPSHPSRDMYDSHRQHTMTSSNFVNWQILLMSCVPCSWFLLFSWYHCPLFSSPHMLSRLFRAASMTYTCKYLITHTIWRILLQTIRLIWDTYTYAASLLLQYLKQSLQSPLADIILSIMFLVAFADWTQNHRWDLIATIQYFSTFVSVVLLAVHIICE